MCIRDRLYLLCEIGWRIANCLEKIDQILIRPVSKNDSLHQWDSRQPKWSKSTDKNLKAYPFTLHSYERLKRLWFSKKNTDNVRLTGKKRKPVLNAHQSDDTPF